ncbi:MAG: bifunctional 5,10-methylenetetrahydrofolate dehydrogenase/5,10-methenyltetrahydrofolate cyclohydrolase [Bacteroidetes bacterium]|nr:bifunctional 5,10-methylenetetrahydrofolate dehydrogenase/5,10-methenyltetrahydrofolate cyclohydrolase [Bacteroidota bacterium]
MILMEGKPVAASIKNELKAAISKRSKENKKTPHLAAILVGNNGASETYVNSKVKNCLEVGIISSLFKYENNITESELLQQIKMLNENDDIDGILVQLPLPDHISEKKVITTISPAKDVDGFNPVSVGNMVLGFPTFISATPYGILLLLKYYNISLKSKHVVIIGRSNIVGTPLSILLSRNNEFGNATVTLTHSHTADLKEICRSADVIIAAIGKPQFIKADMIKTGAIVIDVGINRIKDDNKKNGYALVGDVDFESVSNKSSYISPVPGGVGLMTIAALLKNTFNACIYLHP